MIGEELRQPGHGGDKLDAHPDEHEAAADQQHRQARGKPGRQGGEGIEENAESEDEAPAEQVGEVAPQEAEDAADERRNEEQRPRPADVGRRAGNEIRHPFRAHAAERGERRLDDQWKHQQLIDIECEADCRDRADEPAGHRQLARGGHAPTG